MRAEKTKTLKRKPKSPDPPPSSSATPRWIKHALVIAVIMGVVFSVYSDTLHAPFLLDNDAAILKDLRVHSVAKSQLYRILTEEYWETSPTGLYRPLTTLSFLFNYTVLGGGVDPEGYHWFNLILHMVNIGLVYALGIAVFEQIPLAWLLTALWALHPALTESVTNVVGRSDMMAAFGVLATLVFHERALESAGIRKAGWLAGIVLAVTAGTFAKESGIVVAGAIVLYDLTFKRLASWRSRIPSYIAVAIPCLAYLAMRARVLAHNPYAETPFTDNPLLGAAFWTAKLTAIKVLGKYFGLMIWPAKFSYDYSYNEIPLFSWRLNNWENWKAIIAVAGLAAVLVLAVRSFRRRKKLFFFIAFFFIAIGPVSNLLIRIGTIMGERLLYLPSLGIIGCAVYALQALARKVPALGAEYRYAGGAALGLILIALVVRTYERNKDWSDPQRFWRTALEGAPGNYKTQFNGAANLFVITQTDRDRAIHGVERSLAILDNLPDSLNEASPYQSAGVFYLLMGDRVASENRGAASAEVWYQKARDVLLRGEKLALQWNERYQRENAKRGHSGVTSIPQDLYLALGRAYVRLSDPKAALAAFEHGRAMESNPDLLEELASLYRSAGDTRKAAQALVEALSVDPSRVRLNTEVVELYREVDPSGCAVKDQSLNLYCPMVHSDVCGASRNVIAQYRRTGQQFEAGEVRRIAVQELECAPELLD